MTPSNGSTDLSRSSSRPKRKKGGKDSIAESSPSKTEGAKPRAPLTTDVSEKKTPKKSQLRAKTETAIVAPETSKAAAKSVSTKTRQSKQIKEEIERTHTEDSSASTNAPISTPRKRKSAEDAVESQATTDSPRSLKRKRAKKTEEAQAEVAQTSPNTTTKQVAVEEVKSEVVNGEATSPRKKRKTKVREEEEEVPEAAEIPKKTKRKTKVKQEEEEEEEEEAVVKEEEGESPTKTKRKRKTKEEKEAEAMPLAARTNSLRMYIGAHVSCAKGIHNSVTNCVHIGGNAFAMFLKSQRKWENPPLQDEHRDLFISSCDHHKYDASSHVLPHGSYLVNLAQEDSEKASQAYNAFVDDLQRCEALGIKLYNFHPGSTGSHPRPSAIARIAQALNRAHNATKTVVPVLEAMAGGGNVIGSTFEDLRDIIALIQDKSRIGVCIDTCHVFAAGYDLRTPVAFKKTLEQFDKIVGTKYLRALHLNDSKAPFGSHRDLHQNIGLGFLGLRAFHNVMNEPRFEGLPMVLETPIDHKDPDTGKDVEDKAVWAREIKMLEGLIGMDAESDEFKAMEKDLAEKGAEERKKLQEVYDRKVEKDRKAVEKGQTKLHFGKKKKQQSSERGSDSEA